MKFVFHRGYLWSIFMLELYLVLNPVEICGFVPIKRITIPSDGVTVTHRCFDNGIVSLRDAMRIAGSVDRRGFLQGSWSGLVMVYLEPDNRQSHVLCVLNILNCNSSNAMCRCAGLTSRYRYFAVTFRMRSEMNNSKIVITTTDEVNFTAVATSIKLEPDVQANVTLNGAKVDVKNCFLRVVENTQISFTFCVTHALRPHLTFRLNGQESTMNSSTPCASSSMWVDPPLATLTLSYQDGCGRQDSYVCYFYSEVLIYVKFNNKMADLMTCSIRWPMGSSLTVDLCAPSATNPRFTVSFNSNEAKTYESNFANVKVNVTKPKSFIGISYTDSRHPKRYYSCYITGVNDPVDDTEFSSYDWPNRNESPPFLRVGSSVEYIYSSVIGVGVILIVAVCATLTYTYVGKMKRRNEKDDEWFPSKITSRDILGDVYTGPIRIISDSTTVTADSSAVDTNSYASTASS